MNSLEFRISVLAYCYVFDADRMSLLAQAPHCPTETEAQVLAHRNGWARDVTYDEAPPLVQAGNVATLWGLRLTRHHDHDHLEPRERTATS
jgi:hypothetical protein